MKKLKYALWAQRLENIGLEVEHVRKGETMKIRIADDRSEHVPFTIEPDGDLYVLAAHSKYLPPLYRSSDGWKSGILSACHGSREDMMGKLVEALSTPPDSRDNILIGDWPFQRFRETTFFAVPKKQGFIVTSFGDDGVEYFNGDDKRPAETAEVFDTLEKARTEVFLECADWYFVVNGMAGIINNSSSDNSNFVVPMTCRYDGVYSKRLNLDNISLGYDRNRKYFVEKDGETLAENLSLPDAKDIVRKEVPENADAVRKEMRQ